VELYLLSPNTPTWRGAQLKKQMDSFTFLLYRDPQNGNLYYNLRVSYLMALYQLQSYLTSKEKNK
jgi:hypothetical protein